MKKKKYWYLDDFNSWMQTCNLRCIELTNKEKKEFEEKYPHTTLYTKEIDAYITKLYYEQNKKD